MWKSEHTSRSPEWRIMLLWSINLKRPKNCFVKNATFLQLQEKNCGITWQTNRIPRNIKNVHFVISKVLKNRNYIFTSIIIIQKWVVKKLTSVKNVIRVLFICLHWTIIVVSNVGNLVTVMWGKMREKKMPIWYAR